jgi:hypothetical protein
MRQYFEGVSTERDSDGRPYIVFWYADGNPPIYDSAKSDRKEDSCNNVPIAFAWRFVSLLREPRLLDSFIRQYFQRAFVAW